ncbi:hypothetical protein CEB3_c45110 [Peptococcaceae bacterium CEB3]|nr:hypothetical protein CEB3_c45110 [Peptococcaceae bacterium CEB3]
MGSGAASSKCTENHWIPKANLAENQIKKLKERLGALEEDIEAILLERIRDRDNAERYTRTIEKREAEKEAFRKRIADLENLSDTIRRKQISIKRDIGMIDDILAADGISEAQLRLFIEGIRITEIEGGRLDVNIAIKAPFRHTPTSTTKPCRQWNALLLWTLTSTGSLPSCLMTRMYTS